MLKLLTVRESDKSFADCTILPFFEGKDYAMPSYSLSSVKIPSELQKDFRGEKGETMFFYAEAQRFLCLGLGKEEKLNEEVLRIAFAASMRACQKKKLKSAKAFFPNLIKMEKRTAFRAICEGFFLANYAFNQWKRDPKETLLETVTLVGVDFEVSEILGKVLSLASGVYLARDLVNQNADFKTPKKISEMAESLATLSPALKITVLQKKQIEKEKMGLLLAVNRASDVEPSFSILDYRGNPSSTDLTVLVGKGITYDTGGLSLKPSAGMDTMKSDLGGGAAVLGVFHAVASLGLPINVVGIIPATDNAIGSRSFKPGDVSSSFSGKTVEIVNTDAEGRLILADAIAYAVERFKPSRLIDIATLTGGVSVALGDEITGFLANDEGIAKILEQAAENTGEKIWRLPLYEEYKKGLKSDIADLKNVSDRKGASTIVGALFLQDFVKNCPWAHIDIAGTAYGEAKGYSPTKGAGVGVRLLFEFLELLLKSPSR